MAVAREWGKKIAVRRSPVIAIRGVAVAPSGEAVDQHRTAAEREAASRRKAQDAPGWPLLFITQLETRTASGCR